MAQLLHSCNRRTITQTVSDGARQASVYPQVLAGACSGQGRERGGSSGSGNSVSRGPSHALSSSNQQRSLSLYTGCSVLQDTNMAGFFWQSVEGLGAVNVQTFQQACAFACLARIELDNLPNEPLDGVTLWRACELANECAALGYMPPIVIQAGKAAEDAGWRPLSEPTMTTLHNSAINPELFSEFEKLTALWRAMDKRTKQYQGAETKRTEKQNRRPNAYVCAGEGCGIEATSKSSLMRCSGPCTGENKPSYCSKDCQRRVRSSLYRGSHRFARSCGSI